MMLDLTRVYPLSADGWQWAYWRPDRGWVRAREVVLDDAGEVNAEIAALLGVEVAEDTSRPELYELRPSVDGRRATALLAAGFHLAAGLG